MCAFVCALICAFICTFMCAHMCALMCGPHTHIKWSHTHVCGLMSHSCAWMWPHSCVWMWHECSEWSTHMNVTSVHTHECDIMFFLFSVWTTHYCEYSYDISPHTWICVRCVWVLHTHDGTQKYVCMRHQSAHTNMCGVCEWCESDIHTWCDRVDW